MGTDPYAALVRYYDAETIGTIHDLPAYARLAERFGGPVLDVGCGTGRVGMALAERKLRIVGIDSSEPMLVRAKEKAKKAKVDASQVSFQNADVTTFDLGEQFALAIFAYNGFMHLLEQKQQLAALERIAAHLKPGGGAAIDLPNPVEMFQTDDTPNVVLERTFDDPETGEPVMQQSVASVNRATQTMTVTWLYDRISAEGTLNRHVVPLTLRYTMAAEMRLLLRLAGLDQAEICGDYDFSPYEEDSPRLLVIATRSGS